MNFLERLFGKSKKNESKKVEPTKKKSKKEERIKSIMKKTGWTREETIARVEEKKAKYGITYGEYDKYKLHTAPEEEFDVEFFQRKWKRKQREMCIEETMKKTGWSKEVTKEKIKDARDRMGISYNDYRKYRFYQIPLEDQAERYSAIVKQKTERKQESKQRFIKEREAHIKTVMDATGWDRQLVLDMQKRCAAVAGCDYEHYAVYKLYELSEEEQQKYFTARYTRALRKRYNIDPEILHIFRNKDKTCELLKDFLGRPCLSSVDMSFEDFKTTFANESKVIYKPLASYGGKSVQVFDLNDDTMESVYNEIAVLPDGIVEGFLKQHPDMAKLSLKSVNTIRVATVKSNQAFENVEQNKLYLVYAGLRVGSGSSYVDNLHSGGLICGIDLETGVVDTDGVDLNGNFTETHPDTRVVFKGFQVPFWPEVKTMLEEASKTFRTGYFGWDVAITEDGPVVIEVNTSPGSVILQTPYVPLGKGMGHLVAPYVDPKDVATKYPFVESDEKFIEMIVEGANCSREEAVKKVTDAYEKYGVICETYATCRYWELSDEEMSQQLTELYKNKVRARFNRDSKLIETVLNKELACKYFDQFLKRKWLPTNNMDLEKFVMTFADVDKIVFKPNVSSGGKGIEIINLENKNLKEVYDLIKEYPKGILEEFIVQHDKMMSIAENSVNTIRVVTVKTDQDIEGIEKGKNHILYSALRCGSGDSIVDNLSGGGLVAVINSETGIVDTHAVDGNNVTFEKHPDTGITFKGFEIPFFNEIMPLIDKASENINQAFLGWDIAITADGPILVEVNSNPGVRLLQAPYHADAKGMRYIYDRYLA